MNIKTISSILLLSIVYVISAKVGQLFAIGPGNVTPVWFPSGIIFFAILTHGYKLLPGVFLGAAIGNGWTYISFDNYHIMLSTLSAASLNGIGDVLCAYIGVYFVRRVTTIENFFNTVPSIVTFMFYAVIAGPLVSALFGVSGLFIADLTSSNELGTLFITWFIGDAVGVLLFAPILIALSQNNWNFNFNISLYIIFFTIIGLIVILTTYIPIINDFDTLHILIVLIPTLIYIAFRVNYLVALKFATLSSLLIIFSTAYLYSYDNTEKLNQTLMSLQLFIFLTFTILLFFIVLINILRQEEQKRIHQQQLILKSRQIAVSEMISMIAHQWRQPLNIISMDANKILLDIELDKFKPEEVADNLQKMQEHIKYLSNTLDDFRTMNDDNNLTDRIHVNVVVSRAVGLLEKSLKNNRIDINQELHSKALVNISEGELLQVILNLLNNAKYILIERKIREAMIFIKTVDAQDHVKIIVEDNAGGIDPQHIDKIFDAYYSTKHEVNKSGLGLYMSKIIIEEHFNGLLSVVNTDNGAKFIIQLPLATR